MTIPQQNFHNYSSSLKKKAKLMKKRQRVTLGCCNKFIENKSQINVQENTGCANGEAIRKLDTHSSAMDRAKEFLSKLPPGFPSCLKFMLRSHVTAGFWLSLPKSFTDLHLPNHDTTVVLVDENEEEYFTKYLVEKNGLSGGWKGFSIAHKLVEGDVLIFQLIKPCRIKVYIVRANSLSEIDGAIGLLNLELKHLIKNGICVVNSVVKEENQTMEDVNNEKKVVMQPPCITIFHNQEEAIAKNSLKGLNDDGGDEMVLPASKSDAQSGNETDGDEMVLLPTSESDAQTGNETDDDGIRFSETVLDFKDIKADFESFSILVDGLVIDSEIPKHLRIKYYHLCCSQNLFLHAHLAKGLNCKLAAGIISETVNIADAIRAAAKLDTYCCDHLQTWDKTLKAFEDMGMAVGFLRDKIKKLVCLRRHEEREVIIKLKTLERDQVEINEKNLEAELVRVKEVKRSIDVEIEALKVKNENLVAALKEMATAPW